MTPSQVTEKLYGIFNPDTKEKIRETDHLDIARIWIKRTDHVIVFSQTAIDLQNTIEFEDSTYLGAPNNAK